MTKTALATRRPARPSAVSQALRAIQGEPAAALGDGGVCVAIAGSAALRERARALAERVYLQKGYLVSGQTLPASPQNSVAFLATGAFGHDAGTVTLVFDEDAGLPCDATFPQALNSLRARGRRLLEVTRLAIDEDHRNAKALLVRLINAISVFARRVRPSDDFIIEVNLHHANFYAHLMLFEVLAGERPCARVGGAPAVLMRLDLHRQARAITEAWNAGGTPRPRTLYRDFCAPEQEEALAATLPDPQRAARRLCRAAS